MKPDRDRPHLSRGFAYVEFENPDDAEKALRYIDGGQIDGQEVSAAPVLPPSISQRYRTRLTPVRRPPPPPPMWRRSPIGRARDRRRSPPRYRRRSRTRSRTRSRSPTRRRPNRSSSSSSR